MLVIYPLTFWALVRFARSWFGEAKRPNARKVRPWQVGVFVVAVITILSTVREHSGNDLLAFFAFFWIAIAGLLVPLRLFRRDYLRSTREQEPIRLRIGIATGLVGLVSLFLVIYLAEVLRPHLGAFH